MLMELASSDIRQISKMLGPLHAILNSSVIEDTGGKSFLTKFIFLIHPFVKN